MVEFSVVVATQGTGGQLRQCLAALARQTLVRQMEILIVDGTGRPHSERWIEDFPMVRVLRPPAPHNVPALWSEGIRAAQGSVVALTIENCIPAPDWAKNMLAAQNSTESAAVGGAIEMDPAGSLNDWAIYFCRYSAYMLPFQARVLHDLPGDNCSYKSRALREIQSLAMDGFWETFIHEDMSARGEQLLSVPSPVVVYAGGISARQFFWRRFAHAKHFASRRGENMPSMRRWLRAAAFPAVAAMLFFRIGARVWRNGRHRAKFVSVLPWVFPFLLAWASGEAAGYLDPAAARRPPTN